MNYFWYGHMAFYRGDRFEPYKHILDDDNVEEAMRKGSMERYCQFAFFYIRVFKPVKEWHFEKTTFLDCTFAEGSHMFLKSCKNIRFVGALPGIYIPHRYGLKMVLENEFAEETFLRAKRMFLNSNPIVFINAQMTDSQYRSLATIAHDKDIPFSVNDDVDDTMAELKERVSCEFKFIAMLLAGHPRLGERSKLRNLIWNSGDGALQSRIWKLLLG